MGESILDWVVYTALNLLHNSLSEALDFCPLDHDHFRNLVSQDVLPRHDETNHRQVAAGGGKRPGGFLGHRDAVLFLLRRAALHWLRPR